MARCLAPPMHLPTQAAAPAFSPLHHEVLPSQGIPVQGVGREAYRS